MIHDIAGRLLGALSGLAVVAVVGVAKPGGNERPLPLSTAVR